MRFVAVDGRFSSWQTRNLNWLREIITGGPAWRRPGLHKDTVCPTPGLALPEPVYEAPRPETLHLRNC